MTDRTWQDRAHEDLQIAQQVLELGHEDAAVSHAYYAAFYAATAALEHLGQQPSTHSSVISAFGQYVVRETGADPGAGRALNRLFDSRNDADYVLPSASDDNARAAIARAKIVVDTVDAWLAEQE